jgi:hypothetical protein
MKFLCVPCDTPMRLQSVGPPDRGSLSVVYSCPACGYEMAMLTNAYETQIVRSLGVRIGPDDRGAAPRPAGAVPAGQVSAGPAVDGAWAAAEGGQASQGSGAAATDTGCPFAAMLPAMDGPPAPAGMGRTPPVGGGSPAEHAWSTDRARPVDTAEGLPGQAGQPSPIPWTAAAEARLARVPAFVRPMARAGIERFARERGALEVDEQVLDAAREFFGM